MKDPLPYLYDFLTFVFDDKESRKYIKNIILFGSVATGEYDEKSDIDLFVDVTSEAVISKIEKIMRDSEKRFYAVVKKKWALMGIEMPIKFIIGSIDSYMWKEIKSDIISTGISLYGKYAGIKTGLKHFALFSYSLSKLNNKNKVLFIRKLFGYSQRKKSKQYIAHGYMNQIGGIKIGKNSLLIPIEKSRDAQKFFTSFRLTPEIREIWINEG